MEARSRPIYNCRRARYTVKADLGYQNLKGDVVMESCPGFSILQIRETADDAGLNYERSTRCIFHRGLYFLYYRHGRPLECRQSSLFTSLQKVAVTASACRSVRALAV